jgi:hypothetical protein
MRGFPLLRLFFLSIALGAMAVPVWSLTRTKPDAVASTKAPTAEPGIKTPYLVTLTASSPVTLRMTAANQPTMSSDDGVKFFEARFMMSPDRPEDIAVFANFADKSSLHAVRVEVSSGEKVLADTTLWGSGLVEDVVKIPAP